MHGDNATCFDNFGVEYISKEIKKITGNKNIARKIYRTQANISIMCGHFCARFVDFIKR